MRRIMVAIIAKDAPSRPSDISQHIIEGNWSLKVIDESEALRKNINPTSLCRGLGVARFKVVAKSWRA